MPLNNEYTYVTASVPHGTMQYPVNVADNKVKRFTDTFEVLLADAAPFIYRNFSIPSNARITDIRLSCDAITGATAANIGLYETKENGGAAVASACFLSGQTLASAVRRIDGMTVPNIDSLERPLWFHAGASADTQKNYDIAVTVTTKAGGTGSGTVTIEVEYI